MILTERSQNNAVARVFPIMMTSVLLPFDLSASWSGNDVMNNTSDDREPTATPARIDSGDIAH